MLKFGKKTKTTLALVTMLSVVAMLFTVLPASAQTRTTSFFTTANPNPAGIGQTVVVILFADIYPNTYVPQTAGQIGAASYPSYHSLTLTITKPDGTTETRLVAASDPLGGAYVTYTPSTVGTYYFQWSYPGETFTFVQAGVTRTATFAAATTRKVSLTVQEQAATSLPDIPPTTDYWTRPIQASNKQWETISGNWLATLSGSWKGSAYTNFVAYTKAPNTAHIVWTKVLQSGGIVGGSPELADYYTGESYQAKFNPPVILDGRVYYNGRVGNAVARGIICVDLRTGETLWQRNDSTINAAFVFNQQTENQHGAIPFLVGTSGTNMFFFDPMNGERAFTIANATTNGMWIHQNNGLSVTNDLVEYILTGNRLIKWSFNMTTATTAGFNWGPSPTVDYNWPKGIVYNVSVPATPDFAAFAIGTNGGECDGNVIIGRAANTTLWPPSVALVCLRCSDGAELWRTIRQDLADPGIWRGGGGTHLSSDGGVYFNVKKETMEIMAYSLTNGALKYKTPARTESDWGVFTSGWPLDSAYGKLYSAAYDGMLYAYDLQTGQVVWKYFVGNSGTETPYGTWPIFVGIPYGLTIADYKVFAPTGEHSPNSPLYKGERMHVVDTNTGEAVWTLMGWWLGRGIADGYYVGFNGYDGRIYSIGKGPSKVTVSAPTTTVATGETVLIQGEIVDMSPAQEGTPCVSADSMTQWMEYLNMQQSLPTNTTGVPVKLEAFGADGSYTEIGTVMSDTLGYRTTWTPTTSGVYTILASFAGDDSYGSSRASTALSVGPAQSGAPSANDIASAVVDQLPVQTPVPTAPSASDVASAVVSQLPAADAFTTADYAIIAIVVIALLIGLVNVVLLLKKKQ
jgi:hypothetical protein